jgi:hypothetical protein
MKMTGKNAAAGGDSLEPLLLPDDAAKTLNLSTSWLAKARGDGTGPAYIKLGRAVRYKRTDLLKFIQEQTRTNTNNNGHQYEEKPSTQLVRNKYRSICAR